MRMTMKKMMTRKMKMTKMIKILVEMGKVETQEEMARVM